MTDPDDLIERLEHAARREDDSLLAEAAAELVAARTAIVWMMNDAYPDDDYEHEVYPGDETVSGNIRDDVFTRMAEDESLPHRDDVDTWPDHTPALVAVVAALAGSTEPAPDLT